MNVPRGTNPSCTDVLVVGAGHAGCEAALAAARLGLGVTLVTIRKDRVAAMSCNPAIGGLGKSQIVREIDALGGQMGKCADACAIHFRRLNSSKGPAVRARRVQCDLGLYHRTMLAAIQGQSGIDLVEGTVEKVVTDSGRVRGVELKGCLRIEGKAVILTTGTFLRGLIHVGLESFEGGRLGDPPAASLSASLQEMGISLGRLKTGTPARLDATSIDLSQLEVHPSEAPILPFSHEGPPSGLRQIDCHIARTNEKTHRIIAEALDRSPLYTGRIKGQGPRYCPSIEDKVVRFPDRTRHQVILEPTDLSQSILYPNGISTSLPRDVQETFIHSIRGLESARIVDYGYAIEYDFAFPTQLWPTLETKAVYGLFLAGQINGTSGYEEAAGQGLVAGINAAHQILGREPVVLSRDQAYIGVMIDDLVTRGTAEPYRMFSSRAEFRLLLREDNSGERLLGLAERIGLVPEQFIRERRQDKESLEELLAILGRTRSNKDSSGRRPTLEKLLQRPEVGIEIIEPLLGKSFPRDVLEQAETRIKYSGYIERQVSEAKSLNELSRRKIPEGIRYQEIPGLSRELVEKLSLVRPATFDQAFRIPGMTPAALTALSIWISRGEDRSTWNQSGSAGDG